MFPENHSILINYSMNNLILFLKLVGLWSSNVNFLITIISVITHFFRLNNWLIIVAAETYFARTSFVYDVIFWDTLSLMHSVNIDEIKNITYTELSCCWEFVYNTLLTYDMYKSLFLLTLFLFFRLLSGEYSLYAYSFDSSWDDWSCESLSWAS